MKTIQLKKDYHNRIIKGHLWAWRNDFSEEDLMGVQKGEVIRLTSAGGAFLGVGFANPESNIAFRMFDRDGSEPSKDMFQDRIELALELRRRVRANSDVYRLTFGESDLLPGLIVDKYSGCLVISQSVAGMEPWTDTIVQILDDLLNPEVIILKNTNLLRTLEGLPVEKKVLHGSWAGPVEVKYDGVKVFVDCWNGRKTGLFLDHRENRALLAKMVRSGDRVLDLYSHCGLWSLVLRKSVKCHCFCIDSDSNAISLGEQIARINGWENDFHFYNLSVNEFFSSSNDKFDVVIADPPAFAKKKRYLKSALLTYEDLFASALAMLKNRGLFVASSCSSFVSQQILFEVVKRSAARAGRNLQFLAAGTQALDHPVLPHMPETHYLKCLYFRVVS